MTAIDWVIVAFTILLAFYGYLQGFLVGGLSLLGFALGAFLGTRVGPLLLPGGSGASRPGKSMGHRGRDDVGKRRVNLD